MRSLRFCVAWCALMGGVGSAEQPPGKPRDLTALSLEELMNIEVTSVSKKEQKLSQAAAAVYVITQEDIRRSGATSIPEALRMAPGLQVARINGSKWAISARGFNGQFANKLLVLIDGRSVYTPLFSGVYWDVQDTLLEDIDRIEVIRGPGATMWGANAVNGVINIITKAASQTQGGLVSAGGGTEERGFGGLRYGGPLGPNAHYRLYAKYSKRNHLLTESGLGASDGWDAVRGGFRMDLNLSGHDSLTLQGDLYRNQEAQRLDQVSLSPPFQHSLRDDYQPAGGNVLARWRHSSKGSEMTLQFYHDRTRREDALLGDALATTDVDFQHRFSLAARHELLWGAGYRLTSEQISNRLTFSFSPDRRRDSLYSAFVQDEIALVEDRLRLVVGSKFEHNPFSGLEIQPTAQLAWSPHARHAAWTSVSRAVRTPSPGDQNVRINLSAWAGAGGITNLLALLGNRDFRSEDLLAWELGYRLQATARVSLDLASFYNSYDEVRSFRLGAPFLEQVPAPLHVLVPGYFGNQSKARSHGLEVAANWTPIGGWRWSAGYTGLALRLRHPPTGMDTSMLEGDSPAHQVNLRSYLDLSRTLQWDSALYYVSALSKLHVPAHTRLDTRLGWRATSELEVSVSLQNLLDNRHPEFVPEGTSRMTEIGRSVYGKVTWRLR
jgi:iron complex outermembrane receptor protein